MANRASRRSTSYVQGHAARNLESVAILAAGRSPLSYGRLVSQIGRVGEELWLADIRASDRVAVVLPDGAEAAVAILAVAAHAACAPLNPAYSAREFELLFVGAARQGAARALRGLVSCDRRREVAEYADLVPPAGNDIAGRDLLADERRRWERKKR